MAMNHSAFVFDYSEFEAELRPVLLEALATDDAAGLVRWIDANRSELVDPYEGDELPENWQTHLPDQRVQTYGDFALTKFYDPTDSIGLDEDWEELEELLKDSGLSDTTILGMPLGPEGGALFDPGACGAYFQTPGAVRDHLVKLEKLLARSPKLQGSLEPVVSMLTAAREVNQGLYVTF